MHDVTCPHLNVVCWGLYISSVDIFYSRIRHCIFLSACNCDGAFRPCLEHAIGKRFSKAAALKQQLSEPSRAGSLYRCLAVAQAGLAFIPLRVRISRKEPQHNWNLTDCLQCIFKVFWDRNDLRKNGPKVFPKLVFQKSPKIQQKLVLQPPATYTKTLFYEHLGIQMK